MTKLNKNRDLLSGQRLMVGFDGTELNADLKALIRDIKAGGIILFAGNIESRSQVQELCRSAQAYAKSCGLPPIFIAVDQEGGTVARLKAPDFTSFPGNLHIGTPEDAARFAAITASELKGVQINMNFAPVLDCIPEPHETPEGFESIMIKRAFPGNPERVAKLGVQMIKTFQQHEIMAVAKHFPGIGRTTKDSHLELPVLNADPALLESSDLIPFKAAVREGVAGIMLSHIIYSKLDNERPASLSRKIAKELLRDQLGYQGVIMTDDLDMKAIQCDIQTTVRQILTAEVDMALICHKGPDIEIAFQTIKTLIATDDFLYQKAVESWQRIKSLKKRYLN